MLVHENLEQRWNAVSLRTKMTAVSVFLLTLGLIVAGFGSVTVLRTYLTDEVETKINSVIGQVNNNNSVIAFDTSDTRLDCNVAPYGDYYIAVFNTSGTLLCANRVGVAPRPDTDQLQADFRESKVDLLTVQNTTGTGQWRVVMVPGTTTSGHFFVLAVGLTLRDTDATIARFAAIFIFFGLTVVIVGGAVTRLLVTSTFTPLREVEATAARFAAGDFSQRLGGGAPPNTEVGRLNRSLNSMLARIDRAFADRAKTIDQMRRFVGDASHELRTPLVSVRGYAELYRMGALPNPEDVAQAMERIEKEAIRMGELVEDLLELARIDEAKPLQLAPVDLLPIARDAALDAMASAPDRMVTVVSPTIEPTAPTPEPQPDVATPPPTPARGNALATGTRAFAGATLARLRPRRPRQAPAGETPTPPIEAAAPETTAVIVAEENKIRQVLTNLIGNALRFTPAGSPIEIGVDVDEPRGMAALSVIDHGEGIPPQIREKIFQRFWRADTSRNRGTGGSGLGLAIVASIIAAHKGDVEVVETPGGGATFRVWLPLLQSANETPEGTSAES